MRGRQLVDAVARRRALSALDETLLVEAAAGTGKTELMAGRAAMMIASGVEPSSIAAITFTELAAGELSLRIRRMVEDLLGGEQLPKVLEPVLQDGLSHEQRVHLEGARLDELTATTIHGFCQGLVRAYAVEADLDPGAVVMDGPQADAMFEGAFANWLRRRLSGGDAEAGPIGVLVAEDPLNIVGTLRELAQLRRSRPAARPPTVDLSLRPDLDFIDAVDAFERWFTSGPREPRTADLLGELRGLAEFFRDSLARPRTFEDLWRLAQPPRTGFMKRRGFEWRAYSLESAWRATAGADGAALFETARELHGACRATFSALIGQIASALIAEVCGSLDDLLDDYASRKRAAAALDFDDLLLRARRLLGEHDHVRRALGRRYRHIFVDEFQDTDPLQAEIIFALASDELPDRWTKAVPRPGSLFLVGDPKQAIYRFRGAHVAAYTAVRDALTARSPESLIQITANFRSAPEILEHVNNCFEVPLARTGQPGYVALSPTLESHEGSMPRAVKLAVDVPPQSSAPQLRDAEAEAVADLCARLIGAVDVRQSDGSYKPLQPGDIALLAPTGTELWRYERALERQGLGVASQAGKSLMRRQETQDVLALMRTLADRSDTLAFGALMRGPLVGLTEARLLRITGALPRDCEGFPAKFAVDTNPSLVVDAEARSVLEALQDLRRKAATATPAALLAEAIERLDLRVALALRTGDRGGRAIANLDALIAMARAYRVRGLAAFVADLTADWQKRRPTTEGRIDEGEDAVSLVTIHSAKGLEWPVVIPINTATLLRQPDQFVHRQSDDTLHWILGELTPPHLADAQAEEALSAARERERLWYVAVTRARDILVLPELTGAGERSWSRIIDLGLAKLPEFDHAALPLRARVRRAADNNAQTREIFESEAAAVAAAAPSIAWRRPSEHDHDRMPAQEVPQAETVEELLEMPQPVGAGRARGILLHKLLEELLTGELADDLAAAELRAADLVAQLVALEAGDGAGLDPKECAAIALRARNLPGVADLWPHLRPEVPVYMSDTDGTLLAGRADAIAFADGRPEVVLDWKSDLQTSPAEHAGYLSQLADYVRAFGAARGVLVYLTRGEVVWLGTPDEPVDRRKPTTGPTR